MQITSIKLYQYRSYQNLEMNFDPKKNLTILVGENAQGKTNILEAIYLCATGKSHRSVKDSHLIKWDEEIAYVGIKFIKKEINHHIEMRLLRNRGKQLRIDGNSAQRIGDLMGSLQVVLFSPEDLRLVKDGPGERRRFMDIELSQIYPSYFYDLCAYVKVVSQRNALLKKLQNNLANIDELKPWDEQLAYYGSRIYIRRQQFIMEISPITQKMHAQLSSGKEELHLQYESDISAKAQQEAQDALMMLLEKKQSDDIRKGITLHGPHRDDILISLDQMDMRLYASQGQQRTAALTLKLSELEWMTKQTGDKPIFLLDDVLSELDQSRQEMLLTVAKPYQTILTTTHWNQRADERIYGVQDSNLILLP